MAMIPDRPERISEAFVESWNKKYAKALAAIFDKEAEFVNVVGLWWDDRGVIERAHAYGFERIFTDSTMRLIRTKVK